VIKMIIPAVTLLFAPALGHGATTVGCDPNLNCRSGVAKPARDDHIKTVNVAAEALLRQIVGDAVVRGNQTKR
jgi:hypothetical protein